jgi:hypothetical protein
MMMYQCRLRNGVSETVGWIPERSAKVGLMVELIADDGKLWDVVEVYQPGMSEESLRKKQERDRNSLPSIT